MRIAMLVVVAAALSTPAMSVEPNQPSNLETSDPVEQPSIGQNLQDPATSDIAGERRRHSVSAANSRADLSCYKLRVHRMQRERKDSDVTRYRGSITCTPESDLHYRPVR